MTAARNITYTIPSATLKTFKRHARKISRSTGIAYHAALEQSAHSATIPNWHTLSRHAKLTAETEHAFRTSLVIAMDVKDAQHFNALSLGFVEDVRAAAFAEQQMREVFAKNNEESRSRLKVGARIEDDDAVADEMSEYVFYRFIGNELPNDENSVLALVLQESIWPPRFVWLKGVLLAVEPM